MNLRKAAYLVKDWVHSGYRFGFYFSGSIAERLEVSPRTARVGGAIFDVAAGGGLVYLAATQILGTVVGMIAAVAAVASAPITAVATVAVGVVFTALNLAMGGIGLGLLNAARIKSDICRPGHVARQATAAVTKTAAKSARFVKNALTFNFKKSADSKKPSATPLKKPAPSMGNSQIF